MTASIDWANVPEWLTLIVAAGVAWRLTRGGGGAAVTELSKANEVLTHANDAKGAEIRDLRIEVSALKARTDFEAVMLNHEKRAQERFDASLQVWQEMIDQLSTLKGQAA